MRRLVLIAVVAFAACGDNKTPAAREDAGLPDAAPDAPATAIKPCLDRPTDLPQPGDRLPCELLPPGFVQP
jgi:hypothetical protein